MKFIHTGDWHLGKVVNQASMLPDQEHILQALIALLEAQKPDALVIAGDVYDRSVPPVDAVELLDRTLNTILLDLNIPVLMIAGNHDSADRLGFGSQILRSRGLHIEGRLRTAVRKVTLGDAYGPVNFYLAPYAPPAMVRELLDRDIADHDTAMQALVENIQREWDPTERNVLVSHGFVRGLSEPEMSESEKPLSYMSVGGTEYVDVSRFNGFTYTALGHLHGPQQAGHERVRYSGSLLKYSFSEVSQYKSVTVVNLGKGQEMAVERKALVPLRDMRCIRGQLKELLQPAVAQAANPEDYLHVTLTDEGDILDPMNKLRAVYPNVLGLAFAERERQVGESKTAAGHDVQRKAKLELFRDFYENMTGQPFDQDKEGIVAQTIQAVEQAEGGE